MMRQLVVRPEARLDIEDAARWYDNERPALGSRFLDAVDELITRIGEWPHQFPEIEEGVRRGLLRRFPYGVYFVEDRSAVSILAVLHLHRHPDTWKGRR